MNIDIENFYKLQRAAMNEAKEKRAYYEGFIQGLHEVEYMINWSKTDKTAGICEEDHDNEEV